METVTKSFINLSRLRRDKTKPEQMKKVYLLLFAMGMFTFVACNQGTQEGEETSTETEEAVEEVVEQAEEAATEESELLAEHKCNDNCTEEGCNFLCGEKGHVCSDECKAHEESEHEHGEGEEHPHGEEG